MRGETDTQPRRVIIALEGTPDPGGMFALSPECMTLDQVEGCINALQDELEVLRAEARRLFTGSPGHA
ncbi:MAG TPA: hypothetical protein VFO36_13635 [Nitrospiraceae bacterium]|nr:hypothetical protein [Nitrospiraceae bacterium]